MKRVESFVLHSDDYELLNGLNYEQLGRLFEAIMLHAMEADDYELLREMDKATLQVFEVFADQMDRDWAKYRRRMLIEKMEHKDKS